MVLCQLRDCPKADCDNPIRTKEDCCPICPGDFIILILILKLKQIEFDCQMLIDPAGRVDEMDNSPVIISQQAADNYNNGKPQKIEDCISGGRLVYYYHNLISRVFKVIIYAYLKVLFAWIELASSDGPVWSYGLCQLSMSFWKDRMRSTRMSR